MLHLTLLWPKSTSAAYSSVLNSDFVSSYNWRKQVVSREEVKTHFPNKGQGIDEVDLQDSIGQNGVYVCLHYNKRKKL